MTFKLAETHLVFFIVPVMFASEFDLAGGEGLVLHGHGAVGAQDGDVEVTLSLQSLLVPLLHRHRLKGGDDSHLHSARPGAFAVQ